MVSEKIQAQLNKQIKLEAESSHFYLAMASWAESQGLNGTAKFLYRQSDEERTHMLKVFKYVNERGGRAEVPSLEKPLNNFNSLNEIFQQLLKHEIEVTQEINNLVEVCLKEKDYTTHNFLQWFVAEQIEEEALARYVLDKLKLVGNDKGGLYLFDRDIETMQNAVINK